MIQQENPVWLPSDKLDEVDPQEIQSDSSGSWANLLAGNECDHVLRLVKKLDSFHYICVNVREILTQIVCWGVKFQL
jgi:hypothetical protein